MPTRIKAAPLRSQQSCRARAIWSPDRHGSRDHRHYGGGAIPSGRIASAALTAPSDIVGTAGVWARLAMLALVIAALGLPINDLFRYSLLLIAAVVIFVGSVSRRPDAWLGAVAVAGIALVAPLIWP